MDAAQAVTLFQQELETTQDPARIGRLHYEIARLQERPLGDDRRAALHYRRSLENLPGYAPAVHGLRLTLLRLSEYAGALPLFDQEAEAHDDARTRAALLYRKGVLLEDRLRRRDGALQAYEAAVELDQNLGQAWEAIAELTHAIGDYTRCDAALATCANLAEHDPARRSALLTRRAQLLELKLDNAARATEVYEAALQLDPGNQLARSALLRLFYASERFADLAALLEFSAEHETGHAKGRSLQFAAAVLNHKLLRKPEALAALRRAEEARPHEPDAALLLALGDALEASGDAEALLDNLTLRVERSRDDVERLTLHKRVARLYEEQGELELAVAAYQAALGLSPVDQGTIEALERIFESSANYEALLELLNQQLQHDTDLPSRVEMLLRKGRLLQRLEQPDDGIQVLREALFLAPDNIDVFRALETLYISADRPADLSTLYRQRADLGTSDRGERVVLLLKVANLQEGPLDKPELAAHTYRQVLRLEPGYGPALSSLQHVAARAGLYDQLVEALELEVQQDGDPKVRAALLWRAAQVLLEHQHDRQGAFSRLQRALSLDPAHLPSLISMERIQREEGRFEDLLLTLERHFELTADPQRRIALLLRMAEAAEGRLGDLPRALDYIQRAVEENPADIAARRKLIELLRMQEDYQSLTEVLEIEMESLAEREQQALHAYRLGELHELRIGDRRKALEFYELALSHDPDLRVAFDAWSRIRLSLGEYRRVAGELERRAQQEQDLHVQAGMRLWAAELWAQRIGDMKRAQALLELVMQVEQGSFDIIMMRESVAQRLGAIDVLLQTLQDKAERSLDDQGKKTTIHRLLRLWTRLDHEDAESRRIDLLTVLHELGTSDPELLEQLQELAFKQGDERLVTQLDRAVEELAIDPSLRANHLCRFAEASEATDPSAAGDAYRRALSLDSQSLGAVRGLGRLALRGADPKALQLAASQELRVGGNSHLASDYLTRAAQLHADRCNVEAASGALQKALECDPNNAAIADALLNLLRQSGKIEQMPDVLRRAAECATDPVRKRDLWLEMSQVQLEPLGDVSGALASARKAVEATPDYIPALVALTRLQRQNRRWDDATELLAGAVRRSPPDLPAGVLREAHFELAIFYEEYLGDARQAVDSLLAADDSDAPRVPVLMRLAKLQSETGDHLAALGTTSRLVGHANTPDERADALLLMAHVQFASGNEHDAEESLVEAVSVAGPNSAAAEALRAYMQEVGHTDQQGYVEALLRYARVAAEPQAATALLEAAAFQAEVLGEPAAACDTLQTADIANHSELRAALAKYLYRSHNAAAAVPHIHALVDEEPWEAAHLQLLYDAEFDLGRQRRAAAAAEVLVVLDAADVEQVALLDEARTQSTAAPITHFERAQLHGIVCPVAQDSVIAKLLLALRPAYSKLFSGDLDAYNVDAADCLTEHPKHPLTMMAMRLAEHFGTPEYRLYLHHTRGQGIAFEVGEPGVILIPGYVQDLPEAQQRYMLSQPLIALGCGLELALKLTPRELQVLLTAACRKIDKDYGNGLIAEEILNQQFKQIQRSLPRRNRKLIEPLLEEFVNLEEQDLEGWVHRHMLGVHHVAALASGDLSLVMKALRRDQRDLEPLSGVELIQSSDIAASLVRFWISDQATPPAGM